MPNDKMFSLRIPSNLLEEYKEFCDYNSINISKRLRKFIERDLVSWRNARLIHQKDQKDQKDKKNSELP